MGRPLLRNCGLNDLKLTSECRGGGGGGGTYQKICFCTDNKKRKTYIKKMVCRGSIPINKIRPEIANPGCAKSVLGRLCQRRESTNHMGLFPRSEFCTSENGNHFLHYGR